MSEVAAASGAQPSAQPGTPSNPEEVQWVRCGSCGAFLYGKRLSRNRKVCPECQHHFRLSPAERIEQLADPGSFQPFPDDIEPRDLLGFVDSKPYPTRLTNAQRRSGRREGVLCGRISVEGRALVVAVVDFGFMGGSMGSVVGEQIARAARRAIAGRLPLLLVAASGGARMQEGCLSLMQMAKTAQWIAAMREAGLLVINLNTDPTFGGVTASFAMLGDVIAAEPASLIGFAGPSVIKNTIRQDLPPGFQTAEFLYEHGMIDMVVPRERQRETIARLVTLFGPSVPDLPATEGAAPLTDPAALAYPGGLGHRPAQETVALARNIGRPTTVDYLAHVCDDFVSLHGDRAFSDDPAMVGGIGRIGGQSVIVLGHQKGHDTTELVAHNFGMPNPDGYRKALRLMKLAERFGLPIVAFVDTPGAFPGIDAEERGQALAIAECILELSRVRVPVVSVVTGEGGSGGALGLGVGNRVLMLRNAYYSVISPEGCSTILWGSAANAAQAADVLRLTAPDLLRLGVIDAVVPEPPGGAHSDPYATVENVKTAVVHTLAPLLDLPGEQLVAERRARFDRFGHPELQSTVDWEVHGDDA
ncbi:MAG TPA: acetyl-CoA carboxylase carboxyltransferase subunit alpha [Mycobacteriales bacterium]|nr:acetyl-CoA carboxylase carboxyltransferase subunit alpha [Mycobacteriales bacterium]